MHALVVVAGGDGEHFVVIWYSWFAFLSFVDAFTREMRFSTCVFHKPSLPIN